MQLKTLEGASLEFHKHLIREELTLLGLSAHEWEGAEALFIRSQREEGNQITVGLWRLTDAWEIRLSRPLDFSLFSTPIPAHDIHGALLARDAKRQHFLVKGSVLAVDRVLRMLQQQYPVMGPRDAATLKQAFAEFLTEPSPTEGPKLILNEVRLTGWVEEFIPTPTGYLLRVRATQNNEIISATYQTLEGLDPPALTIGGFAYLAGSLTSRGVDVYDLQVIV